MAGTKAGSVKAVAKILQTNPDFFRNIGKLGGEQGAGPAYRKGGEKASGFAANPELARIAGKKGGKISRRKKSVAA